MSNDMSNPPVPPMPNPPMMQPPAAASFFQTWMDAVTKPYERTYTAMAASPNAKATPAFLWVFLTSLILFFCSILVGGFTRRQFLERFGLGQQLPSGGFGSRIISIVCGAPIAAVIYTLLFALGVGLIYLVARAFGGRGTYEQLAFVLASIVAPFHLVSAVLSLLQAIPLVGLCFSVIGLLVGIYVVVLEVIATKGAQQITWLGAIVSVLLIPVLLFICAACIAVIGLAAGSYAIGNVLSSIQQTPVP